MRARRARPTQSTRATRPARPLSAEAMERALRRFRTVLHEKSLKMSRVREAIARAALTYDGHFSVDDLLRVLRDEDVRDAHMATVYRAMPLMVQAGLIEPALVSAGDGQRYELSFEREHHDHLVCVMCGHVVEYHSLTMEALQREIAERYGFELDEHVGELRGRCRDCRRPAAHASPKRGGG